MEITPWSGDLSISSSMPGGDTLPTKVCYRRASCLLRKKNGLLCVQRQKGINSLDKVGREIPGRYLKDLHVAMSPGGIRKMKKVFPI